MTKVKCIVIKSQHEGNKFANIGEIMVLEKTTADSLIKKGLIKIYDETLKNKLEIEVEKKLLDKALKEEEIIEEVSDVINEEAEIIEEEEIKEKEIIPVKRTSKKGRPSKRKK